MLLKPNKLEWRKYDGKRRKKIPTERPWVIPILSLNLLKAMQKNAYVTPSYSLT